MFDSHLCVGVGRSEKFELGGLDLRVLGKGSQSQATPECRAGRSKRAVLSPKISHKNINTIYLNPNPKPESHNNQNPSPGIPNPSTLDKHLTPGLLKPNPPPPTKKTPLGQCQ